MPETNALTVALITSLTAGIDPLRLPVVQSLLSGIGPWGGTMVGRPVALESLLSDEEAGAALKQCDAALVPLTGVLTPSELRRMADLFEETLTPALLLSDGSQAALRGLESANVFVRANGTDPALLGCLLHTLALRQGAVRLVQRDLRLAQSLQGGAAAELDRLNDELLLAARVQREFLPKKMPRLQGMGASVLFRPAGFVSGDIYDVTRLDEHHMGFFLADAMGHGLPAALMTLFIAGHLSLKQVVDHEYRLIEPAEALRRLNDAMFACRGGASRIASAICGIVDTRDRTVTLATAGHPKPLRIDREGAEEVELSGMLLGVVLEPEFDQVTFRLDEREALLLYSDGLESPPTAPTGGVAGGTVDSLGRAAEAMTDWVRRAENGEFDLDGAVGEVAAELDSKLGSLHQTDDITLIAIGAKQGSGAASAGNAADRLAA